MPEDGAEPERDAPAEVLGEVVLVEQEDRQGGAEGGAQPEGAVDDEVDAAADPGGDELVDGRVDGGVLTADTGAGEEAADEEPHRVHREGGEHRGGQVDGQRDHEEPLAAEPVGQVAEEQRAQAGAGHVDAGRDADLALGDLEAAALLGEPAGDGADDGDLEAVEDPHRAESDAPPASATGPRATGPCRAGMLVLIVPV